MSRALPTTYARVDLSALKHNHEQLARHLAGRVRLMPVVKANAYGHGLVEIARFFAQIGCPALGVASVGEGLLLRRAMVLTPITVFQPPTGDELAAAIENQLTLTITQEEHLEALARWASGCSYEIGVDVGLGRSGYRGDPAALFRRAAARLGCPASGIWTHLGPGMIPDRLPAQPPASWERARSPAARLRYLEALRAELGRGEAPAPTFHVSASAVLCETDGLLWDQVRVGSLLYGAYSPQARRRPFDLRPALELRSRIVELRDLPAGALVGYGGEFRTRRVTRLATLPVGFSHGVALLPESAVSLSAAAKRALALASGRWGHAFRPAVARVQGCFAPLVGRASLNECTVDVTDVPTASLGDEVAVPARMTTLDPTIPRVYENGG